MNQHRRGGINPADAPPRMQRVAPAGHGTIPLLRSFGHTHVPMKRFRRTLVVNPGSVGQPKDGDPRAAYAVWNEGEVTLGRVAYDVEKTISAYGGLGLQQHIVDTLAEVLRTGGYVPLDQNPEELFSAYYQKHRVNLSRQGSGYTAKDEADNQPI